MMKILLVALLPFFGLFSNGSDATLTGLTQTVRDGNTGTLEKMIVASGSVALDVDLNRLGGAGSRAKGSSVLRFDVEHNSFFKVLVFNDEFRGPLPGTMALIPQNSASLPSKLSASYRQLVIESVEWGEPFDLVVRDGRTGFTFFNIEGYQFEYEANQHQLSVNEGRLLMSKEFAAEIGRPSAAGSVVGQVSINATMKAIEITQVFNGEVVSAQMPPDQRPAAGTVPGPDVIVGDLSGLAQFGSSSGTQVGLAVATDSCNAGTVPLNWLALPNNDHPVIPQNLYRMSGGATNDERLEQIGQSNVKHAFTALQNNICGFGCVSTASTTLGSGCSDPYSASLNSGPSLGSRAWINPFTGTFPRGDSATPPNTHTSHTHTGPSHRILVEINDLNTTLNPGATYFAEAQYVTPHEYAWCVANPGQCNMNNNASYRKFTVTGTGSPFTFAAVGATVRSKAAVYAWTGATLVQINPDPVNDGVGIFAYKVTNPSVGVWHYEFAIYNQNLDRAIQSFSVPLAVGTTLSNIGFHAPPQHPGWTFDGTVGNTGYSSTPWTQTLTASAITWSAETFAQNPNANAIRWGTMYNFRFDSNRPPQAALGTISFFKTGAPITVQIQGPTAAAVSVSGRVTTSNGLGVSKAVVSITDPNGNTRSALTSSFGYYRFDNVTAGRTYVIGVISKRFSFTPQTLPVNDNLASVDFVALP
jgi:hypothetical protein